MTMCPPPSKHLPYCMTELGGSCSCGAIYWDSTRATAEPWENEYAAQLARELNLGGGSETQTPQP